MPHIAKTILGKSGRLIASSKGRYRFNNPNNWVLFNANICTKKDGKIWYGDLDLTLDMDKLQDISKATGKAIYILGELDGRFENEIDPAFEKAVVVVSDNKVIVNDNFKEYVQYKNGKYELKPYEPKEVIYDEQYDESEYTYVARCPDVKIFRSDNRNVTPYLNFYNWIAEKLGGVPSDSIMQITNCYVHKSVAEELKEEIRYWIKKFYTKDEYSIQKEVGWHCLDVAPCEFLNKNDWMSDRGIYIKGDFFSKKR